MAQSNPSHPRRLLLAALALLGAAVVAPTHAEPPPWAPAHGQRAKQVREYRYVYYPAQQVYFAPASNMWFWMNGGNWQFGVNLPARYRGYAASGGVPVLLHSSRPYVEHVYVERNYGRPWREKRRKHKERDDWRHDRHHDHDRGPHGHRN